MKYVPHKDSSSFRRGQSIFSFSSGNYGPLNKKLYATIQLIRSKMRHGSSMGIKCSAWIPSLPSGILCSSILSLKFLLPMEKSYNVRSSTAIKTVEKLALKEQCFFAVSMEHFFNLVPSQVPMSNFILKTRFRSFYGIIEDMGFNRNSFYFKVDARRRIDF